MSSVTPLSSVAPGDSASSAGRKQKPGKRERAARRSQVSAPAGRDASVNKAAAFASGGDGPTPQPGRFPVVFQTGAGEPSRDKDFSFELASLSDVILSFADNYRRNPRYAEFRAHSGTTDLEFRKMITVSFLLRLAQQVVHAHQNMGLPQGDFSPVANTEVKTLGAMSAVINQYGEFSVPSLGTRFLLTDYDATVVRLIWAAKQVDRGDNIENVVGRLWLPTHQGDVFFKHTVASALNTFLDNADVSVPDTVLGTAVMSGEVPAVWQGLKGFFGDAPPAPTEAVPYPVDQRDRFDFLFRAQQSAPHFVTAWTTPAATAVLTELGLEWEAPLAGHVNWSVPYKSLFTELSGKWAKLNAAYAEFFEMSSGLASRATASGSMAQMVDVGTTDDVTVVKAHLALSAPEFSLAACFPPECNFVGGLTRMVVVSTPVSVKQRATEFCQLDWR